MKKPRGECHSRRYVDAQKTPHTHKPANDRVYEGYGVPTYEDTVI